MDQAIEDRVKDCVSRTECFWTDTATLGFLARLRRYIDELLPEELALARERGHLPALDQLWGSRCDVLVLLVGHSFEPLLQAICAYQPTEVVPVLNEEYGTKNLRGTDMYRRLKKLLPKLKQKSLINKDKEPPLRPCEPLKEDTPLAVFRFLLEQLRDNWEKQSIVIDITGAKKSMVAGAFFFAAYSNTPISYVDFDRYDEDYGRPYGCTCKIGLIANPYRDFRLRDWAEVRRLYGQYAFAAAHQAMESVCAEMDESGFFAPREMEAARKLLSIMRVYEAWDNGDYWTAKQSIAEAAPPLPEPFLKNGAPWAVQTLGGFWPHGDECSDANQAAEQILTSHFQLKYGDPDPEDSIFAQPKALLAYVQDELAKVDRLVKPKEEYRAAYLRAVGLDEFLLKARLALCWLNGGFVKNYRPVTRGYLGDTSWRRWFGTLVDHDGSDTMRKVLLREYRRLRLKDNEDRFWVELATSVPTLNEYWEKDNLSYWYNEQENRSVLARLRGEAIHTHLYLTWKIADAAVTLVRASAEDFKENWLHKYHPDAIIDSEQMVTSVPNWDAVCRWCGINFLPPYHEEDEHDTMAIGCGS